VEHVGLLNGHLEYIRVVLYIISTYGKILEI
jgi:hypothetical protein